MTAILGGWNDRISDFFWGKFWGICSYSVLFELEKWPLNNGMDVLFHGHPKWLSFVGESPETPLNFRLEIYSNLHRIMEVDNGFSQELFSIEAWLWEDGYVALSGVSLYTPIAPARRPSQKESSLPTPVFQVPC